MSQKAESYLSYIVSLIFAIAFGFNSPIHPFSNGDAGVDSSVFKTVTMMMERGYVPYKDSFDHKGPLIYFINWLGNRISYYRGIWVIEVLAISITFYFMYRIARISCNMLSSFFITILSVSLLFYFYDGGNFTEEYAMPLIAVSLYIFLDYLVNNTISRIRLFISGTSLTLVLMLRPNMISVWFVFCIAILAVEIKNKQFQKIAFFSKHFITGMVLTLIPFIIWLAVNNNFYSFFQDYVVFNMKYNSSMPQSEKLLAMYDAFINFMLPALSLALACIVLYFRKNILINTIYTLYLAITLYTIIMGGMGYYHYGMVIVPSVVYPISLLWNTIEHIKDTNTQKALMSFCIVFTIYLTVVSNWLGLLSDIGHAYLNKDTYHRSEEVENIVSIISSHTNEDDKISVYGNWDLIYVLSNRAHATKYSYQYPIGLINEAIMNEYFTQLQNEQPQIIVVEHGYYKNKTLKSYINKNNYTMIYAENPADLNESALVFEKVN